MNPPVEKNIRVILFKPFAFVAGGQALLVGIAAILPAGLIASLSRSHFDGVLDFHNGLARNFALWFYLSEGIIDWLCLAISLLAIGRIFSRTPFRTIDLFGTQAMARWPSILIAPAPAIPAFHRYTDYLLASMKAGNTTALHSNPSDAVVFGAVVVGILVLICWMVALMYQSYSISCNTRGGRSAWTFITGILLAEVLSKFGMYALIKLA